jgi:hypothetical protein
VGYLRPVNQWNKGKREEFRKRKTFVVEPVQPHEIGVKRGAALDSTTKISKAVGIKGNYGAVEYKQLDLISFSDDGVDENE